jgi:hypothetical protein
MSARWVGVFLALLCLPQAARAQDFKAPRVGISSGQNAGVSNESLNAGVVRVAMRAVVSSPVPPSQRDMLGILVLMSLRQHRSHGV